MVQNTERNKTGIRTRITKEWIEDLVKALPREIKVSNPSNKKDSDLVLHRDSKDQNMSEILVLEYKKVKLEDIKITFHFKVRVHTDNQGITKYALGGTAFIQNPAIAVNKNIEDQIDLYNILKYIPLNTLYEIKNNRIKKVAMINLADFIDTLYTQLNQEYDLVKEKVEISKKVGEIKNIKEFQFLVEEIRKTYRAWRSKQKTKLDADDFIFLDVVDEMADWYIGYLHQGFNDNDYTYQDIQNNSVKVKNLCSHFERVYSISKKYMSGEGVVLKNKDSLVESLSKYFKEELQNFMSASNKSGYVKSDETILNEFKNRFNSSVVDVSEKTKEYQKIKDLLTTTRENNTIWYKNLSQNKTNDELSVLRAIEDDFIHDLNTFDNHEKEGIYTQDYSYYLNISNNMSKEQEFVSVSFSYLQNYLNQNPEKKINNIYVNLNDFYSLVLSNAPTSPNFINTDLQSIENLIHKRFPDRIWPEEALVNEPVNKAPETIVSQKEVTPNSKPNLFSRFTNFFKRN